MATPAMVGAQQEIPGDCELQHQSKIQQIMGADALNDSQAGNSSRYTGLPCLLDTIITVQNRLFYIILVVALVMLLVGAFQFLTAGANEEQTGDAQTTLIYALVGVAVAFLSRFALDAVINMLG
ncbi:MAG: hypothetical protein V5A57_00605 [Candidatus Paceibacterota bacterium]